MSTDQMAEAFRRQAEHVHQSHQVDRRGWTRQQWVADAERLLSDVDGSVMDLLNGHARHLLAEIRDLREERDAAPRNTLLEVAGRLDGEIIPTQDECVAFLRDVAEEYPHGRYQRKPEWVAENGELAGEVERLHALLRDIAVARRGGTPQECDREHEDLPEEIRADHRWEARQAEEIERLTPPSSWRISGDGYGDEPCLWDCAGDSRAWRVLARHDRLPADVWEWLCRVVPALEPEREGGVG